MWAFISVLLCVEILDYLGDISNQKGDNGVKIKNYSVTLKILL